MDIVLRNRLVTLKKDDVLGQGGEAIIFKDPDSPTKFAIKVYHDDPGKLRAKKLEEFFKRQLAFPENVISPLEPVYDPKSQQIAGFVMKQLDNRYRKMNMLFKRSFCQNSGITTKTIVEIFLQMLRDLNKIHPLGIVIGDFNENNQMVHETQHAVRWIDTDSWQWGKYPCPAGTQMYLSPDLYGVDLSKKPMFKPEHDWWSYSVLLTRALLAGVHPFRSGDHPQWKSVTSRAENGATVFDSGVSYPDIGLPPEVMTDEIIDILMDVLKRKDKNPFPEERLAAYGDLLVECKSCGLWYPAVRSNCPGCKKKTTLDMGMRAMIAGIEAIELLDIKGRILDFRLRGSMIYCVALEKGMVVLYTKDGNKPFKRAEAVRNKFGMEFSMLGDSLVICEDPTQENAELYILDVDETGVNPVASTTTRILAGDRAVYSATKRFLYRIADRMLLSCERDGENLLERPVTQVFNGQTWFTAYSEKGEKEFILGYDRIFNEQKWFFILGDAKTKRFNRFEAQVPDIKRGETVLERDVQFSSKEILLIRKTRFRGNDSVRMDFLSTKDGSLVNSYSFKEDQTRPEGISGKSFLGNIIMHPSDKGVLKENLADGNIAPLAGTEKYVSGDDQLFQYENGILVVKEQSIMLLKSKK